MRILKLVIVIALAVVLMLIVAANLDPVELRLFPAALGIDLGSIQGVPLALVIAVAFLIGFLLGEFFEYARERKYRRRLSQNRRELALVREENARLARQTGVRDDELALIGR